MVSPRSRSSIGSSPPGRAVPWSILCLRWLDSASPRSFRTTAAPNSWGDEAVWVPDADTAFELLSRELAAGDVVLFKSSRDAGLRWLGDRLAGLSAPDSMEDAT